MKTSKWLTIILVLSASQASFSQDGKNEALETLGAASGMLIYNTYIVIGSIGDGYESQAYDEKAVGGYMNEQIASLDNLIAQYNTLQSSGFITDPADSEYIQDLLEAFSLLKSQAEALKSYTVSLSDTDANIFQDKRNASWTQIAALLGIE